MLQLLQGTKVTLPPPGPYITGKQQRDYRFQGQTSLERNKETTDPRAKLRWKATKRLQTPGSNFAGKQQRDYRLPGHTSL